jgi:hypothetical protein
VGKIEMTHPIKARNIGQVLLRAILPLSIR